MSDLIISGKDSVTGQNREAELSDQFIDKTGTQVLATEAFVEAAITAASNALNSLSEILGNSTDSNTTNGNDIIISTGDRLFFENPNLSWDDDTTYLYRHEAGMDLHTANGVLLMESVGVGSVAQVAADKVHLGPAGPVVTLVAGMVDIGPNALAFGTALENTDPALGMRFEFDDNFTLWGGPVLVAKRGDGSATQGAHAMSFDGICTDQNFSLISRGIFIGTDEVLAVPGTAEAIHLRGRPADGSGDSYAANIILQTGDGTNGARDGDIQFWLGANQHARLHHDYSSSVDVYSLFRGTKLRMFDAASVTYAQFGFTDTEGLIVNVFPNFDVITGGETRLRVSNDGVDVGPNALAFGTVIENTDPDLGARLEFVSSFDDGYGWNAAALVLRRGDGTATAGVHALVGMSAIYGSSNGGGAFSIGNLNNIDIDVFDTGTIDLSVGLSGRIMSVGAGTVDLGPNVLLFGAAIGTPTATIRQNAGTPEGVITAPVGSLVMDVSGGLLWIKKTGVGNTGWVALAEV